jgi:hypothetical protein
MSRLEKSENTALKFDKYVAHGSVVIWGTKLQGEGLPIPDQVIGFFNWLNPSSRNMAQNSTQPLTEMSTGKFPGGKVRPLPRTD